MSDFLLKGASFKLNFNGKGNVTSFYGYQDQLQGQWVALVDATNSRHIKGGNKIEVYARGDKFDEKVNVEEVFVMNGVTRIYITKPHSAT